MAEVASRKLSAFLEEEVTTTSMPAKFSKLTWVRSCELWETGPDPSWSVAVVCVSADRVASGPSARAMGTLNNRNKIATERGIKDPGLRLDQSVLGRMQTPFYFFSVIL